MKLGGLIASAWLVLLSCFALAADSPPTPPIPPTHPITSAPGTRDGGAYRRPLPIGPKDSTETARPLTGKVILVANMPRDVEAAAAEFFMNDTPLGAVGKRPFILEFDSLGVADGDYSLRSHALDSDGKRIWSATARVRVDNSRQVSEDQRPRTEPKPSGNPASTEPRPKPSQDAVETDANTPQPSLETLTLDKTYSSRAYGFSIDYPSNWIVRDETKDRPTAPGGFWLTFASEPVEKAPLEINIHRKRLSASTDADVFARFNNYVNTWQRETHLGFPVFVTTSGNPSDRSVVHRLILIADRAAWMFNLTDRSGRPSDQSARLFRDVLNTFRPEAR